MNDLFKYVFFIRLLAQHTWRGRQPISSRDVWKFGGRWRRRVAGIVIVNAFRLLIEIDYTDLIVPVFKKNLRISLIPSCLQKTCSCLYLYTPDWRLWITSVNLRVNIYGKWNPNCYSSKQGFTDGDGGEIGEDNEEEDLDDADAMRRRKERDEPDSEDEVI